MYKKVVDTTKCLGCQQSPPPDFTPYEDLQPFQPKCRTCWCPWLLCCPPSFCVDEVKRYAAGKYLRWANKNIIDGMPKITRGPIPRDKATIRYHKSESGIGSFLWTYKGEALRSRLEKLIAEPGDNKKEAFRTQGVKLLARLYHICYRIPTHGSNYSGFLAGLEEKIGAAIYEPLHPELKVFDMKWLAEDWQQVEKEGPVAWRMSLFSKQFCDLITEEMLNFKSFCRPIKLNVFGVYLDEYGWKDFMLQLVETLNEFLSTRHYNITLEYNTSYILAYKATEDGHRPHDDQTDLTINCCLNSEFEGGELEIEIPKIWFPNKVKKPAGAPKKAQPGAKLPPHHKRLYLVAPQTYQAVVHPGEISHSSYNVTSGQRIHLMLWLNASSKFDLFTSLDEELQGYILSFLLPSELSNVALCNQHMLNLTKSEVLWEAVYRGLYGAPERDTSVHQKEVNEASSWIERVKIRKTRPRVSLYGYHHMSPQTRPALPPSYTPNTRPALPPTYAPTTQYVPRTRPAPPTYYQATRPALPQVAGGPAFPYPPQLGGPYTPGQYVPRTRPAPPPTSYQASRPALPQSFAPSSRPALPSWGSMPQPLIPSELAMAKRRKHRSRCFVQ